MSPRARIRAMNRCAAALVALAFGAAAAARAQDFCACQGRQSLGSLNTNDPASVAAVGASNIQSCFPDIVTVPVTSPDGVVVFDDLTVSNARNNACNVRL